MEQFTNKNVRELLRAEFARNGKQLESALESQLLMHCRSSLVCNPLYVVSLSSVLLRCAAALIFLLVLCVNHK